MRKARWDTPECKQRIDKLLRDFGNSEGKARQGQDDSEDEEYFEEDARSDEDLYKAIKQAVEVDDWVGPIEAHIELWERGVQGPQKRGTMLRVIPQSTNSVSPVLKATDLVPPECRHHFASFDPSRQARLDLDDLRRFLSAGKKKLAYCRALGHIRPRRR
ncbi:hypothetical protein VTN77DRAFT_4659 [Rasamsonia byssochlamydoides]|uniref:uncharacterized protein n=1 Tax=Rasamsonia byssochlamydoides TaxID=89139 RepID=UPI0037420435